MNEKQRTKNHIKELQKHLKSSKSRALYALKRLDIILIALSSSGMLLGITYLKDNPSKSNYIEFSIIFFVLAIIFNVLSQWFGYYNNNFEIKWARQKIAIEEESLKKKQRDLDSRQMKKFASRSEFFKILVNIANWVVTILFFTGSILLLLSF